MIVRSLRTWVVSTGSSPFCRKIYDDAKTDRGREKDAKTFYLIRFNPAVPLKPTSDDTTRWTRWREWSPLQGRIFIRWKDNLARTRDALEWRTTRITTCRFGSSIYFPALLATLGSCSLIGSLLGRSSGGLQVDLCRVLVKNLSWGKRS